MNVRRPTRFRRLSLPAHTRLGTPVDSTIPVNNTAARRRTDGLCGARRDLRAERLHRARQLCYLRLLRPDHVVGGSVVTPGGDYTRPRARNIGRFASASGRVEGRVGDGAQRGVAPRRHLVLGVLGR